MQSIAKWIFPLLIVFTLGCQAEQDPGQAPPAVTDPAQTTTPVQERQAPAPTSAAVTGNYIAGTHYEVLPQPVPTADPSRIEVSEVFSYSCVHCYDFEPLFQAWAETLPDDVAVVHTPAMWDQQGIMERHARIYYTAKALGVYDTLHMATYRAIHEQRNHLDSDEAVAKLFEEHGVSREDFDRTFRSFGVNSAVSQAEARLRGYRTQGTPEIVVNGTYRISGRMVGDNPSMLGVANFLIDKVRQEQARQ